MEERKSRLIHSHFMQSSSPFRIRFPAPCALRSAGFADSNQWLLEEGGEVLA